MSNKQRDEAKRRELLDASKAARQRADWDEASEAAEQAAQLYGRHHKDHDAEAIAEHIAIEQHRRN